MIGLVVHPDGTRHEVDLSGTDDGLAALQSAVDGYVEAATVPGTPPMILWVNEDGRSSGLPINPWATMFMAETIVGTVVLTGGPDGQGGIEGLPEIWRI